MAGAGIASPILTELRDFVARHMGLHFDGERMRDLERGLTGAAPELGFKDPIACAKFLMSNPLSRVQIWCRIPTGCS